MKKLVFIFAAAVGFSSISNAATTRGYIYQDRIGQEYFDGLDDLGQPGSGFQILFAIRNRSITEKQYDLMQECMKKKETHAIQIVESVEAIAVPSGIPGRNTSFHKATREVACVPAPGFLQVWRKVMGAN